MNQIEKPNIDPNARLLEITTRAIVLGAVLSMILSAATVYFGLFAGLTVSASIPAAVISMALLRFFRNSNILENNLVQTAASGGESLAAGIIFTMPALVIMGYWKEFNYFETSVIAFCGGVLGVLFTIPLRSALIIKEKLKFPEGIATSVVLKAGEHKEEEEKETKKRSKKSTIKFLLLSSLIGGSFKLGMSALNLWKGVIEYAFLFQQRFYTYFSINLSPALIAVGYIVGLNIASLIYIGGVITWWVAIPIYIAYVGFENIAIDLVNMGKFAHINEIKPENLGTALWSIKMRYLGVGAMVVGGLWALLSLTSSLSVAFKAGVNAFKKGSTGFDRIKKQDQTEMDTPLFWVVIGIGVLTIPIFMIYLSVIENVVISLSMTFIMLVVGFLFSAVAGYMAGLVGSSNNPISGVTISTVLFASFLLLVLIGTGNQLQGAATAILVGAVVCSAAAIAGDNMQDLKTGHILGATPYRQQIMQMVGVVAGAITIPWVLNILLISNGIGPPTPEHPDSLTAPQATLMMSVAQGVFSGGLPWNIIGIGAGIAIITIVFDEYLRFKNATFRMPVLAVAVGLYLPFELDATVFVGGLLAYVLGRITKRASNRAKADNVGLLVASGLITG